MSAFSNIDKRTRFVNRIVTGLILLLLVVSVLMIGSNRTVYWLLNATVLMGATSLVLLASWSGFIKLRFSYDRWRLLVLLATVYLVVLLFQLGVAGFVSPLRFHSQGNILIGILRVVSYGCLMFLTLQIATNVKRARRFAWGVFGIFIVIAVYGFVSFQMPELLFYEKEAYKNALSGPFINRNSYATYLAMGCALGTSLVLRSDRENTIRKKRGKLDVEMMIGRLFLFMAVLLLFAGVLATGSRMGTFVGLLGIAIPLVLRVMQSDEGSGARNAVVGLSMAVTALLGFVLVSAAYGGLVFERLGSTGISADVRWALYENIWQIVLQRPLFGHGFDSFELAFRMGHELPVSPDLRWQNAHNTYLELWVELGVIFGSIPPLLCGLFLLRLWKRGAENQYTGYLAQAAVSVIVIAAIHSFVDFSLEIEANVFMFIVIVALGMAPNDTKIVAQE